MEESYSVSFLDRLVCSELMRNSGKSCTSLDGTKIKLQIFGIVIWLLTSPRLEICAVLLQSESQCYNSLNNPVGGGDVKTLGFVACIWKNLYFYEKWGSR